MDSATADALKSEVEARHGGTATLAQTVPIDKSYGGLPIWRGAVYIFDLEASPSGAPRAYAWIAVSLDGQEVQTVVVLHLPPILSPVDAVCSAVARADTPQQ